VGGAELKARPTRVDFAPFVVEREGVDPEGVEPE
jgi:hypothetical protein